MALKNMNDIRAMLCEEIEKLRSKKTTAAEVNAITNATGKILSTIKLEMEYAKLANKQPSSTFIQLEDVTLETQTQADPPEEGKNGQEAPQRGKAKGNPVRVANSGNDSASR